jgi:hypothetical protein
VRRLFFVAVGVGAIVALVASLSVNVLLHWSEPINVLDAPRDQVAALTPAEINDKLLSGALRLKMVSGMEKAVYFFVHAPSMLAYSWAYFFVPAAIAAFLGGLLVGGRRAAWSNGGWMGFHDLRTPDRWMSIVSAVLLAGYFLFAMYALLSPSNDPQQGMAQGFIIFVGLVLLSLGGALWFGVARKHPWMVRTVFALSIFPALSQTAQEIFLLVHRGQ